MDLSQLFTDPQLHNYAYALLFLGMFIDANLTILGSVFLFSQGLLNPAVVFLPVVLGAFVEQFGLYSLGEHWGQRDRISLWVGKVVEGFDRHLTKNIFRSLLISKFALGLHRSVLIRLGMLKVDLKNFAQATLKSTGIWLLTVGALGFIFSSSYKILLNYFKYAGLLVLLLLGLFFVLQYFVSRRLKKDLSR